MAAAAIGPASSAWSLTTRSGRHRRAMGSRSAIIASARMAPKNPANMDSSSSSPASSRLSGKRSSNSANVTFPRPPGKASNPSRRSLGATSSARAHATSWPARARAVASGTIGWMWPGPGVVVNRTRMRQRSDGWPARGYSSGRGRLWPSAGARATIGSA